MNQNENHQYHYTYGSDNQPGENFDSNQQQTSYQTGSQEAIQEMKPVKKNQKGMKITAFALVCALAGGAVGGGVVWALGGGLGGETSIHVSSRPVAEVKLQSVDGQVKMSDAEVYAANVNSVVSINVTGNAATNFFGQPVQTASAGSGFVLTKDGFIVTNYHVVENADTVKVTMYNGDEYDAKYVGGDEEYDIAVIKVDASDLQTVTLGDSTKLNVGDHVLAVGNPLGELTFSMSGGMVSSVNRAINVSGTPFNMIQTDTSINPGNSGGPLFNQYGEVVGIVSAKYSSYSNESVEGLGFAIPMNDVVAMIQDIMTNGYITNKPYLGITPGTMNAEMAAQFRYDIDEGVFIYSVEKDSAAAKAGLQMGDVITKVDDTEVKTVEDLNMAKKKYAAGDQATLNVYRQEKEISVEITWGTVPADQKQPEKEPVQPQPNSQNPQNGDYYFSDPFDMFQYFFN